MTHATVRLALNVDGPAIKAMHPGDDSLSYDAVHPYWLVAEIEGKGIVGCIQTLPSRPIGHLEMMATISDLSDIERGHVIRQLLITGMGVLHYHGASEFRGFVSYDLKGYKRVLKKRGATVVDNGNLISRRIA